MKRPPRILCIGGHDPTGGAGIQADIETVTALGCRALTLVTALTAQDTRNIVAIRPTPAEFFTLQFETLLHDIRPDAIKIGLVGSNDLVAAIRGQLQVFDGPIVLDPVLAAGGGFDLDRTDLAGAICAHLLPLCTLATPNMAEARRLAGCEDIDQAAQAMLQTGIGAVLVTGADEAGGDQVTNQLFRTGDKPQVFTWPRLPNRYHGSGCTLASACAARLALGDDPASAAAAAQAFTWRALDRAAKVGADQWLPRRCP